METLEFIADKKANYIAEQILWILPDILPVLVFTAVPEFYWGYGVLLWVWFIAAGIALIRLSLGKTDGKSSGQAPRTAGRMPGTPPSA